MYELDFAYYDPMLDLNQGTSLDQGSSGTEPEIVHDEFLTGGTDGLATLPEGTDVMTVYDVVPNEAGNEVWVPRTMIRLPDGGGWMNLEDWKDGYAPDGLSTVGTEEMSQWQIGDVIEKDGFTLLVSRTVVIIDGEDVFKPLILIKEGDGGFQPLYAWEKERLLDAIAAKEKSTSGDK